MNIKIFFVVFSAFFISTQSQDRKRLCEYNDVSSAASTMTCREITSETDMDAELRAVSRYSIRELSIESATFRFFLHGSFKGTKFKNIRLNKCAVMGLTDKDVAFEGLEDHLESLGVEKSMYVNRWNWNHLRNLRRLKELIIARSDLDYIPETFQNIARDTLEELELSGNQISMIHENAFSAFRQLSYLNLENNQITELKRSMFPDSLKGLEIKDNFVKTLPADFVSNMPRLEIIAITGNFIRTIDERIFGKIWGRLRLFQYEEGHLSCDCRLKWIATRRNHPSMVFVRCNSPPTLKGRFLLTVKADELWC